MALNGLVQGSVTQHTDKFRSFLYWQVVNSQDDRIARNVSRVRIIPLVDTTASYQDWDGNVFNCSLSINGQSRGYGTFNSNCDNGWTYTNYNSPTGRYAENILEQVGNYYEIDVPHNTDGTKTLNISCSLSLGSGGWGPGEVRISGDITLDTIPRASYITSDSNLVIGNDLTVNIGRYSDQFVHTIKYYVDLMLFKEQSNIQTSYKFTMSNSDIQTLYELTADTKELNTRIVVETYKDNTLIGVKEKQGKLIVNEAINRPIFEDFTFQPIDNYTYNLTDWNSAINEDNGLSIATITKYKIICGQATAQNEASISKYEVELNGKFYTSTSNEIDLNNPIMNVDYLKVSVYDSRGFKTTISKRINPIMYSTPNVLNLSLSRPSTTSVTINAQVKITEQSGLNNQFWGKYRYKLENSSTWSDYVIFGSTGNDGIYTINETVNNISALNTYEFEFIFGDSVCTLDTIKRQIIKIIPELEIKKNKVLINGNDLFKRQYIGSQVLLTNFSGAGPVNTTKLLGEYNYSLIDGLFKNIEIPTGFHKEYRLTFQGTSQGELSIIMFINNIQTNSIRTWSGTDFREIGATAYFKETDIVLEQAMSYSRNGCNLKYKTEGVSGVAFNIYNATIHGYIVADD